ncbi:MAG: hypothetical protein ACYC2Y_00050 [Armatimonadota bacterium]
MKIIYFDTNVYRFIASCDEVKPVREFLENEGSRILASASNLFETYRIPNREERHKQLLALRELSDSFEQRPQSWYHAKEVRAEVRRCRPSWLRKSPDKRGLKKITEFIHAHKQRWDEELNEQRLNAYKRDFEVGVNRLRESQQFARTNLRKDGAMVQLVVKDSSKSPLASRNIPWNAKMAWRIHCLSTWYAAIAEKSPESRDYADWLLPYLTEGAFQNTKSYIDFWLRDASAENVPKNCLIGLVSYYQTEHKLNHGNAVDQIHSSHFLDVDIFVTADRQFHEALCAAAADQFPERTTPVLIDRNAPSALEELSHKLAKT